jgi:hypothetical protein
MDSTYSPTRYCVSWGRFLGLYKQTTGHVPRNTPKHQFWSNGVKWMLHNFGTWNSAFSPETHVLHLLGNEDYRNAPKHFQTSFWFLWCRMHASQLWYPKLCIQAWSQVLQIYMPKDSKMLQNTLKHLFGSME